MGYEATLAEFHRRTVQLAQAYPDSARLALRYHVRSSSEQQRAHKRRRRAGPSAAGPAPEQSSEGAPPEREPVAFVVLRMYEPHSGVCIQYRTDKLAEIGRVSSVQGSIAAILSGNAEALPAMMNLDAPATAKEEMEVEAAPPPPAVATPAEQKTTAKAGGKKGKKRR